MSFFGKIGNFVKQAAQTAGKPLHAAAHLAASGASGLSKIAGKVPLVGPALHAVIDAGLTGPFRIADQIASGARLDKVALGALKDNLANVKEVAPYAQIVVANIPGIGTGISGVIGGSIALAEGKKITDALKQAVLDSVPGGALGKTIASVGSAVMSGQSIDKIALSALPLPAEQKQLIGSSLLIAKDLANGKKVNPGMLVEALKNVPGGAQSVVDFAKKNNLNVGQVIIDRAMKTLPPEVCKSLTIGMALGHAQKLQAVSNKIGENVNAVMLEKGQDIVKKDKILSALMVHSIKSPSGFLIGTALMRHSGVTPETIKNTRKRLSSEDKKGFDLALATHIGRVTSKLPPIRLSPIRLAGYYSVKGMKHASPSQKRVLIKAVAQNPEMKSGAMVAAKEISETWWGKVKKYFGIA